MTLTRKHLAIVLLSVVLAVAANWLLGVNTIDGDTGRPTGSFDIVRYEDGSGILYQGKTEVQTFPEGTFEWHCETMGNRVCGDIDDADLSLTFRPE